jgi:energy-converting hydrogenase Eha subunit A
MSWLEQVAPTLASALLGPLGGLAVTTISKVLGVDEKDVQNTIDSGKMTSDQIAQLKIAEIEFQKQTQELGLNFEKLATDDRKSARDMQSQVKSALVPTLAIIIVSSFIAVVVGTLLGYSKIETAMAGTLVGYLSAKAEQVVAFYFGSSNGSQAKDNMLWKSTPTNDK